MKNELKLEFKRCLNNRKFKYCFIILFVLSILSYAMLFKQTFNCNSLELQRTVDYSVSGYLFCWNKERNNLK